MAFAPTTVYKDVGDGTILGCFREKETGNLFEYSVNNDGVYEDLPHKIWVTSPIDRIDQGYRYGKVLKTVAHIKLRDTQLPEKWEIKDRVEY